MNWLVIKGNVLVFILLNTQYNAFALSIQLFFISEEKKAFEELQELVLSREKSLKFETNKLNSVSTQIERIESQISRWNVEDQDQSSPFVSASTRVTISWQC